jgi:VanZ family protein
MNYTQSFTAQANSAMTFTKSFDHAENNWPRMLIGLCLLLILISTLFPYSFFLQERSSVLSELLVIVTPIRTIGLIDLINNVLLFLPLGFGLSWEARKIGLRKVAVIAAIVLICFSLSLTVELLQIFLPSRYPSLIDVFFNTISGFLGCIVFNLWESKLINNAIIIINKAKLLLYDRKLIFIILGYIIFTFLISVPLQKAVSLSNWDSSFPLLLGNEQTGNRPWKGHIYQLQITNRPLTKLEIAKTFAEQGPFASIKGGLLASYKLVDDKSLQDQTGHLSTLLWKGEPLLNQSNDYTRLTANRWLETKEPVSYLARMVQQTNQFTLSTTAATADIRQIGPARIISYSSDPWHRNFTLGQEGSNLVFRMRTPLTGENGMRPELVIPEVFADTRIQHIAITYDGAYLLVYLNGRQHPYSLELSPGAKLFSYLLDLDFYEMSGYKIAYYGIVFFPLGLLLCLFMTKFRSFMVRQLFLIVIILALSSMLEAILVKVSGRAMRLENLVLSFIFGLSPQLIYIILNHGLSPTTWGELRFRQSHSD